MVIKVVTTLEVDIGLKRPATLPIAVVDQDLMFMGEGGLGIIPATIPPINQVDVLDCRFYHFILVLLIKKFMNMRE